MANPFKQESGGPKKGEPANEGLSVTKTPRIDLCPFLGRIVLPVEQAGGLITGDGMPKVRLEVCHGPCIRQQCVIWNAPDGEDNPEEGCRFIKALLDIETLRIIAEEREDKEKTQDVSSEQKALLGDDPDEEGEKEGDDKGKEE